VQDLNDLLYFAAVVTHGGFAPAGRALRVPKSKLSRRVAGLEARLGVRLLERSTRRFRVTEVGRAFHRHCESILAEVEAAEGAVARVRAEPAGLVRLSCPIAMAGGSLAAVLPAFLAAHPQVRVQVLATDRRIDLIEERVDLALRVRTSLEGDAQLIRRILGTSRARLVAAPRLLAECGAPAAPAELVDWPTLAHGPEVEAGEEAVAAWTLTRVAPGRGSPGEGGKRRGGKGQGGEGQGRDSAPLGARLALRPRLTSGDFGLLLQAACAGLGVALLPEDICAPALADGRLLPVLPDWHAGEATCHLVFTARRGLLPAVRALVDHLVATLPAALARGEDARAAG